MKDITTELNRTIGNVRKVSSNGDVFAKVQSSDLTIEQKQAIKYFFERLHRVYQAEYRRQLPDESTERAAKAEFGDRIMNIPLNVMDKGFDSLHDVLADVDSYYRFMKLDPIIELIKTGGNARGCQDGAYKVFQPSLPEPEYQRQKRKEKGLQHTSRILNMFDEG